MKHPIQPLAKTEVGTLRFKRNEIVCHLLDKGGIDMNKISILPFSQEDREQFAQLIGYSLGGFGELSYVSNETYNTASNMYENDSSETQARIDALEEENKELIALLKKFHSEIEETVHFG